MFNGLYVFITVDFVAESKWNEQGWLKDDGGVVSQVYDSFLDLSAEKPDLVKKHKHFSDDVRRRMAEPPFNYVMPPSEKVCTSFFTPFVVEEIFWHHNQTRQGYGIENARFLGAKIWHTMPSSLKESHTLNSFKRDIKKYKFKCNCRLCKRSIQNLAFL